jgi:predicted glycosyltransferase
VGLGHFRRNLTIARALSQLSPRPSILMISGAAESSHFPRPRGVDYLTLPALTKNRPGSYGSRSLGVSSSHILEIRSRTLHAALACFDPDVLIVDNVPRGAARELDTALTHLRSHSDTFCILGLRDVLDDPAVVRREWEGLENEAAIRDFYDAVWVYGDPSVCDLISEYGFSESIARKLRYVGYLDRNDAVALPGSEHAGQAASSAVPPLPYALCMVGGGEDGGRLADVFSRVHFTPKLRGVILAGPFMPPASRAAIERRAARNPLLRVADFVIDPTELIRSADRVITMGGYNSVSEVLSFDLTALVVPRVTPRLEQWIRATRLARLGLLDVCDPADLSPEVLGRWLTRDRERGGSSRERIDLSGLERLPRLFEELCVAGPRITGETAP